MTPKLKVLNISYSDTAGGAAIGAMRFHKMLQKGGAESTLAVVMKGSNGPGVISLPDRTRRRKMVSVLNRFFLKLYKSKNPVARSYNLVPMNLSGFINDFDCDVVQFHWVGANTLSIFDMAAIKKPVFWKLPDMWAFSGTTHYDLPLQSARYKQVFNSENRPEGETGLDIERFVWAVKRRFWRNWRPNFIGPSSWITRCVSSSYLFRDCKARHILNPLDMDVYKPLVRNLVFAKYGLDPSRKTIMFGALNALNDKRKGVLHLRNALEVLSKRPGTGSYQCLIMGANGPENEKIGTISVRYLGSTDDAQELVEFYNLADVFVLPAEMDNLPNVVKEAAACGVLCTGFEIGGLPDLIEHRRTGYLAQPFDASELADGISWCLDNGGENARREVRNAALKRHDQIVVFKQVEQYYREAFDGGRGRNS